MAYEDEEEVNEIYQDGYRAALNGISEYKNPYTGIAAEFWSDGHADGIEDSK
ncbi:ribosome modulation factor [Microbulbifer epialgicus]|uniref:Uncharacterized protein n=1 Tax=Microbulbifer epialgicus TaxID=393907 RepID=A0ABV4NU44_9GAMM